MRPDILILGAGMAGASLAYFLGRTARVLLVEAEDQPGYHSTGRSAAFYAETYGGPGVQPLTSASKRFFHNPPEGFSEHPLVGPRGALHVETTGSGALENLQRSFAGIGVETQPLNAAAAETMAPLLRPEWRRKALYERSCLDIDVAALHAGFLAGARRGGAELRLGARVESLGYRGGEWIAETSAGRFAAPVVVNAAGAWADPVARLAGLSPLRIEPRRRTVVAAELDSPADPGLPLVIDAAGSFYFKPEGSRMWISPHDETPVPPSDVQPEEIDVAIAIDRFEAATSASVRRVVRSWAGLRSFAPDRLPVYGYDPRAEGFFWCAGQGGFGIQTAPAAGRLAAALLMRSGEIEPGLDVGRYAPARLID